jgi:gamma-glutamyltranspeptidase/glutathione hydrolase
MQRLVILAALLLAEVVVESHLALSAGYDRPVGNPHQSRSAVIAARGIVATSQPLASQAGLAILQQGGNAIDAAIAANAVLGVVEPMSCGIGGDLFCIYWDSKSAKLYGLNASGRSPHALNRDVFKKLGLVQIPTEGPLSWSVPGCVAGWGDLLSRFGTKSFAEVLAPAIRHAEEGFPVSEIIAADWRASAKSLARWPDSAKTWLIDGRGPRTGEIFRNRRLAASLRLIADQGAAAFYQGKIAAEIVRFSESNGGYFGPRDFADHRSEWVEPVSTNYRGYDVWELPPPGQGISVLEILNLLEPYDLRALGHNSAEHLHLLVEAKKLAYADRAKFYADPEFADVPVRELISKEYAESRRRLIDPHRASREIAPGNPRLVQGDTIYLCAVDKDRNCCSLIQSNFHGFGSQVTPGDLGFVLQNRGALFSLEDDHANRLEPHKHPFHTIIPGMATKEGRPWLVFGVMGGDMQPQGHVQVLCNLIDFGMNVQEAGDAARCRHFGSATPTGLAADPEGSAIVVESGVSDEAVAGLRAKGHTVLKSDPRAQGGYGGYQAILIDHQQGTLQGGSDPRKDGCAVGY